MSGDSQQICFSVATCSTCYCAPPNDVNKADENDNANEINERSHSAPLKDTAVDDAGELNEKWRVGGNLDAISSYSCARRDFHQNAAMPALASTARSDCGAHFARSCRKFLLGSAPLGALLFALLLLIPAASADCGCGARCEKYSEALQCTRCCTTAVRRSVSLADYPPEALGNHGVIDDKSTIDGEQSPQKKFGKPPRKLSTATSERRRQNLSDDSAQYRRLSTLASLLAVRELSDRNSQTAYLAEVVAQLKRLQSYSHSSTSLSANARREEGKPSHNIRHRNQFDFTAWLQRYLSVRR